MYIKNLPEVHDVIQRLRAMTDSYPGERVLIGETYVPTTAEIDPWYGGASHNELQLPMDTLLGIGRQLDANHLPPATSWSPDTAARSQPLFVFDNHDNVRSWDRFGDGVHNAAIARIIATVLLTSRAAVLLVPGAGDRTDNRNPQRVEDVRDPIGMTGWPKEKGRDGERTPMQWDTQRPGRLQQQPPHLAPRTPNYPTVNVRRNPPTGFLAELVSPTDRPASRQRRPAQRAHGDARRSQCQRADLRAHRIRWQRGSGKPEHVGTIAERRAGSG